MDQAAFDAKVASIQVLPNPTVLSKTSNPAAPAVGGAFAVDRVIVHPQYPGSAPKGKGGPQDVALLRIVGTLPSSAKVATLPEAAGSPSDPLYTTGREYAVAGWGSVTPDSKDPNALSDPNLKKLALLKRDQTVCASENTPFDEPSELCTQPKQTVTAAPTTTTGTGTTSSAPLPADPQSSCQGDSGGPLYAQDTTFGQLVVGVVSRGPSPCTGVADNEGVYAQTRAFRSWIETQIGAPLPKPTATTPPPTTTTAPTPPPVTTTTTPTPPPVTTTTATTPRPVTTTVTAPTTTTPRPTTTTTTTAPPTTTATVPAATTTAGAPAATPALPRPVVPAPPVTVPAPLAPALSAAVSAPQIPAGVDAVLASPRRIVLTLRCAAAPCTGDARIRIGRRTLARRTIATVLPSKPVTFIVPRGVRRQVTLREGTKVMVSVRTGSGATRRTTVTPVFIG